MMIQPVITWIAKTIAVSVHADGGSDPPGVFHGLSDRQSGVAAKLKSTPARHTMPGISSRRIGYLAASDAHQMANRLAMAMELTTSPTSGFHGAGRPQPDRCR